MDDVDDADLPAVMTCADVAGLQRVSPKTVADWCARGDIAAKKLGLHLWRIKRADYLRFRDEGPPKRDRGRRKAGRGKVGGPSRQKAADRTLDRVYGQPAAAR